MIRLAPGYAELSAWSNFSVLRGASHPEEMIARAVELGLSGLGLADRNSVAGVVRAHAFLRARRDKVEGFRFAPGARLVFCDATPDVIAYPETRKGWGRLTRLLTAASSRAQNGRRRLRLDDLLAHSEDLRVIVTETAGDMKLTKSATREATRALVEHFRDRAWIGVAPSFDEAARVDFAARAKLARELRAPAIALNEARYHAPGRRALADVMACIREGETLDPARSAAGERAGGHLRSAQEMARLFVDLPEALDETLRFLRGLSFSLDELAHRHPETLRHGFATAQLALAHVAEHGARARYPEGAPETATQALAEELALIEANGHASTFLVLHELVRFARERGILFHGRGSATHPTLCFCLGVTDVDPTAGAAPRAPFVASGRDAPPDIVLGFEHERRDEAIGHLHALFGHDHAGLAAAAIRYRDRSATHAVAQALGLSQDMRDALAAAAREPTQTEPESAERLEAARDAGRCALIEARDLQVRNLADELRSFPRRLSRRSGRFAITHDRLDEVVPIVGATAGAQACVEWDKADLDALGILTVDLRALGVLSTLRRGFAMIEARRGRTLAVTTPPHDDPHADATIGKDETLGALPTGRRATAESLWSGAISGGRTNRVGSPGEHGARESHAATAAPLDDVVRWMKARHPDAFCAAILNARPPVFPESAHILRDARAHGVEVRPVDVNASEWDTTLEDCATPPAPHPRFAETEREAVGRAAVRLGLRRIAGLREDDILRLVARRGRGYDSARDVWLRGGLSPEAIETLAGADAFASLGLSRRDALWAARRLGPADDRGDLPLFPGASEAREPDADLPPLPPGAATAMDHRALALSLKAHPLAFLRARLTRRGATRCAGLADILASSRSDADRRGLSPRVTVAGLAMARRRPDAAGGIVFMAIEDESGGVEIIVRPKVFERARAAAIGARLAAVTGRARNEAGTIQIVADKIEDWSGMLSELSDASAPPPAPVCAGKGKRDRPANVLQLRIEGLAASPARDRDAKAGASARASGRGGAKAQDAASEARLSATGRGRDRR